MKKLFNSKFLIILASSIVMLILLVVGAFYLFDDTDDVFVKSGYVLNPLSSQSEKYYFDEFVGYKENLSSMIEFTDVDENKVSIVKDSFVHYLDDSLSLLKNGAILDLDSVKGNNAVSFYNITNESIIEKKDSGYVIESKNGDIQLKNFIGRISDDKYIVVGDLNLKMAGNATSISGEYFEIVYVEEGIVNIENKDVKYQVAADNTLIYVGSDKVIDLGNKKIIVDNVDIMSITAITIDGDENIEIIPKGNKDDEDKPSNDDQDDGTSGGEQGGQDNVGGGNNNQDTPVETPGDGTEDGGTSDEDDSVIISLKDVSIGSTDIDVVFDVVNEKEDDLFKLQVVNLSTGRTVNVENFPQVIKDVVIPINLLTPNTKYLFMVINEKDNGKYFQKVLETNGFGVKLEKAYATSDSLAYNIIVEEGTDIVNAKLTLKKYNEETKKLEPVPEKEFTLSSLENIEGEHIRVFEGLESDTIYTAVLDEFSVASTNFKDIYNISVSSMTLKQTPRFDNLDFTKDIDKNSFDLFLENIDDPDNAIVGYTYMIYDSGKNKDDKADDILAVEPIVNSNAAPITVKVGSGENELRNNINYYYKVVIEYFDNEKYIEYITVEDSIIFKMENDPYITVEADKELITYSSIGGTITLRDFGCTIPLVNREDCNENAVKTILRITPFDAIGGLAEVPIYQQAIEFDVVDGEIRKDFYLDGLQPGMKYYIEVVVNNPDALEPVPILHTEKSDKIISTLSLSSFDVRWIERGSNEEHVVNVGAKLAGIEGSGSMSPSESAASIKEVVIKLYEGDDTDNLDRRIPLVDEVSFTNDDMDIKAEFYDSDNGYIVSTLNTFNLTLGDLEDLSKDGKLSEYYTISVEAYYDLERKNKVNLGSSATAYRVNPQLVGGQVDTTLNNFMEKKYQITKGKLNDKQLETIGGNLINGGTVVGYNLSGSFSIDSLVSMGLTPKKLHFYVYDKMTKQKLDFYYEDEDGNLVLTEGKRYTYLLTENTGFFENINIYMGDAIAYGEDDGIMRRGHKFVIGYEIESVDKGGKSWLNTTPLTATTELGYTTSPTGYGVYREGEAQKEMATLRMYVATSTADSITYDYKMEDPDNAIYKEDGDYLYYFYLTLPGGRAEKHAMEVVEDAKYNQFAGRLTIDGLTNNSVYSLSYKADVLNTGSPETDVLSYVEGLSSGTRIFDGYYDLAGNVNKYNFNYEIINDSLKDNRVVIKLLVNPELLDRILSYRVKFEDSKGNVRTIELGDQELKELSLCPGDSDSATPRCLSIDYSHIKEMKSDVNEINSIKTKVEAIYDNGLVGYDFKVGNTEDSQYPYMIFQENSTDLGVGGYIVVLPGNNAIDVWEESDGVKGYYSYKLYSNGNIFYHNQRYPENCNNKPSNACATIQASLGGAGYMEKWTLNPKMVSVDEMSCKATSLDGDCNTFSFSSITPKVTVSSKSSILNGGVQNLQLSGVAIEDIKEEDGDYYLYVETWDSAINAGKVDSNGEFLHPTVRPTLKVKINKDNPTSVMNAVIDGVEEANKYYFVVYAYMLKGIDANGKPLYERTQLFDGKIKDRFEAKIYDFSSAGTHDVFHSSDVAFTSLSEPYGDRTLTTKINLLGYKGGVSYNFDLIYVMCETGDVDTCGPNEGDTNIFKKEIPLDKLTTSISDDTDISEYDLEFGKDYHIWVYAKVDYYNPDTHELTKRNVVLNRYDLEVYLKKLTEPTFKVTRNAVINNGDYVIDFTVVPNDKDKTLVDGKYKVKLTDAEGNLVGNMQLMDEDGNYYDVSNYNEYLFDATIVNKKIRIAGLDENTRYTFTVYGDAYINNYSEEIPKEQRTYEVAQRDIAYTTSNYGVAFGAANYSFTDNSLIVTFVGGSNFENVKEVHYTVALYTADRTEDDSGYFVIGENDKYFELYKNAENWRFVINPRGMKNELGKTYFVSVSFRVLDPLTGEIITIDSRHNSSFEPEAGATYQETDD